MLSCKLMVVFSCPGSSIPTPCKDNRQEPVDNRQEPVDNRQEPVAATLEFGRKKVIFETWDPSDIWS